MCVESSGDEMLKRSIVLKYTVANPRVGPDCTYTQLVCVLSSIVSIRGSFEGKKLSRGGGNVHMYKYVGFEIGNPPLSPKMNPCQ